MNDEDLEKILSQAMAELQYMLALHERQMFAEAMLGKAVAKLNSAAVPSSATHVMHVRADGCDYYDKTFPFYG